MFELNCNKHCRNSYIQAIVAGAPGVTSDILAQRNEGRVLAVDRSRHAVQMAARRFPELHLGVLDVSSPHLADSWLQHEAFWELKGERVIDFDQWFQQSYNL